MKWKIDPCRFIKGISWQKKNECNLFWMDVMSFLIEWLFACPWRSLQNRRYWIKGCRLDNYPGKYWMFIEWKQDLRTAYRLIALYILVWKKNEVLSRVNFFVFFTYTFSFSAAFFFFASSEESRNAKKKCRRRHQKWIKREKVQWPLIKALLIGWLWNRCKDRWDTGSLSSNDLSPVDVRIGKKRYERRVW